MKFQKEHLCQKRGHKVHNPKQKTINKTEITKK